jgi:hypothetical protein
MVMTAAFIIVMMATTAMMSLATVILVATMTMMVIAATKMMTLMTKTHSSGASKATQTIKHESLSLKHSRLSRLPATHSDWRILVTVDGDSKLTVIQLARQLEYLYMPP